MKRKQLYRLCGGALAAAGALLASPMASAQDMLPLELPENINLIGLAVASVPDYYGSSKNDAAVGPLARYHFQGGNRYVQVLGPEVTLNLLEQKEFRAGPILRWRGRRDDDVDDDVVKRMRPVPSATELGAFAAYHLFLDPARPLHKVVFSADVTGNTNNVYNGATGNLRATYYYPFPQSWMGGRSTIGTVGFGMFFASGDFNRRYFGVTGSDVALYPSLGGREYVPDSGLTSIKIPFSVTTQLDKRWLLTVGGRYERLLNDAKDSPVVDQRGDASQWGIGAAVSYLF